MRGESVSADYHFFLQVTITADNYEDSVTLLFRTVQATVPAEQTAENTGILSSILTATARLVVEDGTPITSMVCMYDTFLAIIM